MAAANNQMAAAVKDSSKGLSDVKKAGDALGVAANETKKDLGVAGQALIMQGGTLAGTISSVTATANRNVQQGIETQADAEAQRKKIEGEQAAREKSQAAAAANTQAKLNELGQTIMGQLMPAVANLLSVFNPMIQASADFLTKLIKVPGVMESLVVAVGLVVAGFTVLKVAQAVAAARELARTGGRKLGTPGAPMIVQDVSGAAGGSTTDTKGTKGTSKMGGLVKGLAGGVGGVLGGLALGAASNYAKEKGMEKTSAGLDIGSSALTGAGTGAMLGSIVPGVGTAIGGALGGLAGGAYGLYQNFGTLFGGKGNQLAKPSAAEEVTAAAMGLPSVTDGSQSLLTVESPIEKLVNHMERLNIQTSDMVRYLKETAENTRRNVEATKQLSGNLFPT
jgi:hypothetical protein